MGSIGDVFPYAAPVISSTDWANWIAVTDELIDRVSSPVPLSALTSGKLNMNGNSIIDVYGIEFLDSPDAVAATPGLIRYKDGEWYLVTDAGTVQVTDAGTLNITAAGGIGGDYGTGPESARFVNASQRYDFWDDFAGNAYGYVRARGFDINNGAGGANYCRLAYGTAANITLTMPTALPAANRSVFTVTNGGQLEPNTAVNTITNNIYLGNVEVKHTKERQIMYTFKDVSNTWTNGAGASIVDAGATDAYFPLDGLQVGWRIKSVTVRIDKGGAANTTINLNKYVNNTFSATVATQAQGGIGSWTVTATVGAPAAITATDTYAIHINPDIATDRAGLVIVTYDIP